VTAPFSLLSLITVTVSIMCDREECSFIFVMAECEGGRLGYGYGWVGLRVPDEGGGLRMCRGNGKEVL
jgi:hypothetical protein